MKIRKDRQKYNRHGTFSKSDQNASDSCASTPEKHTSESQEIQLNDIMRFMQHMDQKIDRNHKEGMRQIEEVKLKQDATSDMKQKNADLEVAYIDLKERLEKKVERMEKLNQENENLHRELQKMKLESQQNQARFNAMNKDKERLEKEKLTLQREIDKLTAENRKLRGMLHPIKPRALLLLPPLQKKKDGSHARDRQQRQKDEPHARDHQQHTWNNNFLNPK